MENHCSVNYPTDGWHTRNAFADKFLNLFFVCHIARTDDNLSSCSLSFLD